MSGPEPGAGVSGSTGLVGLIGWPVAHTLSPAMHNAAATHLGLDLLYVPLPVRPDRLAAALTGLPALGFLGVNVTVPHKESVIPLLNEVDPAARAIGAVNTIVIGDREAGSGKRPRSVAQGDWQSDLSNLRPWLTGYNTDWTGFMGDLVDLGVEIRGKECWVLGAGGSARAVVYGLGSEGGLLTVFARRLDQARKLAGDLGPMLGDGQISICPWTDLKEKAGQAQPALIVNTTPVGMAPDEERSPWPEGTRLPAGSFVYDLVYSPRETMLMRRAKSSGAGSSGGLGMLVRQGAEAFQLWTGQRPDLNVMRVAIGRTGASS